MRLFVFTLLAVLAFLAAPTRAQSSADPGDLFVNAYMAVQQGEKAEQSGNFKVALSKLRSAASVLDDIATHYPNWQPSIVDYRRSRTAEAISRVQEKIAKLGGRQGGWRWRRRSAEPVIRSAAAGGQRKAVEFSKTPMICPRRRPVSGAPAHGGHGRHPPRRTRGENNDLFAPAASERMKKLQGRSGERQGGGGTSLQTEKAALAQQAR